MKAIDYDRLVKGRLVPGWYWAIREEPPAMRPAHVAENLERSVRIDAIGASAGNLPKLQSVDAWRNVGWQFYRARLPKPR